MKHPNRRRNWCYYWCCKAKRVGGSRTCPPTPNGAEIKSVGIIGAGHDGRRHRQMNFANAGSARHMRRDHTRSTGDGGLKVVRGKLSAQQWTKGAVSRKMKSKPDGRFDGKPGTRLPWRNCESGDRSCVRDMELSAKIFTELDRVMKPGAILATVHQR